MPTIRLTPSRYSVSNSTYVSVTDPSNMYTNTDSTTFATLTHTSSSTSRYNVFIRGFNFSSVPNDAVVTSYTIKIKGSESYNTTAATNAPRLVNGTTELIIFGENFNTSVKTITKTPSLSKYPWSTITGYGSNFGIGIILKRTSASQQGYVYIYGVEIEVTYSIPGDEEIYYKSNGSWVAATDVYKKVNGSWVLQSDLSNVFDSQANYVKGE